MVSLAGSRDSIAHHPSRSKRLGSCLMTLLERFPRSEEQTSLPQAVLRPNQTMGEATPVQAKSVQDVASHPCIPELVSEKGIATPQAVAVATSSGTLTYAELNRQANQLAHYLKSLGVGREHVVGLYLERSPAFIVAALATFKAGAAYLPLDPDSPAERTAFMLRDSGVSALVTSGKLANDVPSGGWPVVNIETDALRIGSQSAEAPTTE